MNFDLLLTTIQQTHSVFQQNAVKAVNVSLTLRNWLIGYYIVEFEQNGENRAEYGSNLLKRIASELSIKGLVSAELSRCRQFYFCYPQILGSLSQELTNNLPYPIFGSLTQESTDIQATRILGSPTQKLHTLKKELVNASELQMQGKVLVEKLSFTHFVELIKISDPLQRLFYEMECIKGSWSVRELKRQINTLYYERSALSKQPEKLSELTQQQSETVLPIDVIKSVYAFEFLGLNAKDIVEESDLEKALIEHIQAFILELGNGFCFEGRQKRILIDDEHYFIDLVFYHRILKCHVIVELKLDEFKHEHLSQLNTYVSYYREEVKREDDNPPIGILMCTKKGKKLVEYALSGMDEKLFVSKYMLELPSKEMLTAFLEKELINWNTN
jgi:predicted nuclease of restriction endonuclease-like (RecB) superfamily